MSSTGVARARRRPRPLRVLGVAAVAVVASAHVGSPDVFFDGAAGPYDVRVIVRPPSVVPGLAEVVVRVRGAEGAAVRRVVIRPVFWRAGTAGAPGGDAAGRVPGEAATWSGRLWLMARGAYSVYVTVDGRAGTGTAIVPVQSAATRRLAMSRGLAFILVPLGLLLVAGLVTIVHAAAGESLVPPGGTLDPRRRRRARWISAATVPVLGLLLLGGARWWDVEDRDYQARMDRPRPTRTTIDVGGGAGAGGALIRMRVLDPAGGPARLEPVMPDHGKMMHLFLVRAPALDVLAHLHPTYDSVAATFTATLPPLPPGRYRVYGDIAYETGAERTLVDSVQVPAALPAAAPTDSDDAWTAAVRAAPLGGVATLTGGATIASAPEAVLRAGRELTLRFAVRDASGRPARLEPYLGMAAHAVVMRRDGSVYVHLHPMGTVSPATQQAFVLRDRGDTTPSGRLRLEDTARVMPAMRSMAPTTPSDFSFPYEFPRPGDYRVWVQVKLGGRVQTAAFDVTVPG